MDTNNNENAEKTTVSSTETETLNVSNEEKKEEVVRVDNKTDLEVSPEDKKEVAAIASQVEEKKEDAKDTNTVSSGGVKPTKKQNKSILPLFLCIAGFVCLGIGVFFALTTESDDATSDNTNNSLNDNNDVNTNLGDNATEGDNGDVELMTENIKDYSTYTSFAIKGTNKVVSSDITMETLTNANFDILNKMIYVNAEMMGFSYDVYYDLNNKMHYYSMDNVSWSKGVNEEMTLPDYAFIINKVKSNDNVTSLGEGVYLFDVMSTDISALSDIEESVPVPVTVTFDANGYLVKITYDLINALEGATEYSMCYEFSNINTLDSIIVPENVLTSAVETPGTISFQF